MVHKYAKFLNEMMARHKKIKVGEQVHLSASYNELAFIFEKLGLGNLKVTQITLQLVDRSSVHPKRVLEDVLVKYLTLMKIVRYQSYYEDISWPLLDPPLI
ncbi:gag-asp_proteas domain-containing protein [Gossypium australe]|uniref:Gag-asp_proteas domain-containing protein n=1 Tax=Gossypium australe TaxID=47621 RepID=A0A5B6VLW8_9ROSI|nr:gag-asp_proteas domain-containing protein [Gossypium australe]